MSGIPSPFQGFGYFRMNYPEFRWCFTPGSTCAAPPVLPIDCSPIEQNSPSNGWRCALE